jgi:hypothetical protein
MSIAETSERILDPRWIALDEIAIQSSPGGREHQAAVDGRDE